MDDILLKVEDLKVEFLTDRKRITAVDSVTFDIKPGEIIGIVGESGCGKSVMAQSILRLLEYTDNVYYKGKVVYAGKSLLDLSKSDMRKIRGNEISMIFQDPLTSLNPVYTIGNQINEVQIRHRNVSKSEAEKKTIELLTLTGINNPEQCVKQYPFELSGGMQQRVMIAMALACEPKLLIADEPTTALDVTIQAQILDLIKELNEKLGMAVLFISHDLGVISQLCDSVKVMYLGQIVEDAMSEELFQNPLHPYTLGLFKSIPRMSYDKTKDLHTIEGIVPSLWEIPTGCRFSTRCEYATEKCVYEEPPVFVERESHKVRCWHYKEIATKEKKEDFIG